MSYNIIDPFKLIAFNSETFCKISGDKIVHTNQDKVQGCEEVTEHRQFHWFSSLFFFPSIDLKIE